MVVVRKRSFGDNPVFSYHPVLRKLEHQVIHRQENHNGFGMVLHNAEGGFLVACSLWIEGLLSVREEKAIGMVEVLFRLQSMGLKQMIVDTDAKGVVDTEKSKVKDLSEFRSLIQC
ncbi:hypothetical protein PTKIN_Ptkin01aG0137100 [Pterospermum kingtungense]